MPKKAKQAEQAALPTTIPANTDDSSVDTLEEMNFDPNCLSPDADGVESSSRKRARQAVLWTSQYVSVPSLVLNV